MAHHKSLIQIRAAILILYKRFWITSQNDWEAQLPLVLHAN